MANYNDKLMQEVHFKLLSMESLFAKDGDKVLADRIREIRMAISAAKTPAPATAREEAEG